MISPTPKSAPPSDYDDPSYPQSQRGTPVWEVAALFPLQGQWDEDEYLALETNHLVEFEDGCVEFLPMPTYVHQLLLLELSDQLRNHLRAASRRVLVAPYRVRLRPGKYREPDILYVGPTLSSRSSPNPARIENATSSRSEPNMPLPASPNTGSSIRSGP
jgi:Uma2 family endonuclease